MRCDSCNCILSTYECSLKDVYTGEYINLCCSCCKAAEVEVVGNPFLDGLDYYDENIDQGD